MAAEGGVETLTQSLRTATMGQHHLRRHSLTVGRTSQDLPFRAASPVVLELAKTRRSASALIILGSGHIGDPSDSIRYRPILQRRKMYSALVQFFEIGALTAAKSSRRCEDQHLLQAN